MGKKNVIKCVTASAAIASALFFAADEAGAATHKVKRGESLWLIAQKYNTTVAKLKSINNLKSDIIYPNQVLKVGSGSSTASVTSSTKTYTVKRGDTLSGIALKYKVTVKDLMNWNNLSSTLIYPGDVLSVSGPSKSSSKSNKSSNSGKSSGTETTYTVKRGDTLSGIAFRYGVSYKDLMKWNNLTTTLIFPGDVLKIKGGSPSGNSSGSSTSGGNKGITTYTVKKGDSLWKISRQFGITIAQLKSLNNLRSDVIYPGQKLTVKGSANTGSGSSNQTSGSGYNVNKLINVAKSFIGVPYVWGGSSPSGFDCSGFIYYVYNQAGKKIPRTNAKGYYNRSYYVSKPQVGDLVFFKNTYTKGISHLGIYIGNNQFINANNNGVEITSLNNSYWKRHFDSFKRFY